MPEYVDVHRDEPIMGECPYCHLPIYESDPHNMVSPEHGGRPRAYHRGCALTMRGHDLETKLAPICQELRSLGYKVDLKITRPST